MLVYTLGMPTRKAMFTHKPKHVINENLAKTRSAKCKKLAMAKLTDSNYKNESYMQKSKCEFFCKGHKISREVMSIEYDHVQKVGMMCRQLRPFQVFTMILEKTLRKYSKQTVHLTMLLKGKSPTVQLLGMTSLIEPFRL